jgi:hypothetical protein
MLVQDRANDPYHVIAVLWSRKCQLESSRRSIYCVQIDLGLVSGVKLPPEVFSEITNTMDNRFVARTLLEVDLDKVRHRKI